VDNQPVTLLYGALPAYRPLQAGVSGADVRQLKENLKALGYRGHVVDDAFTDATTAAVRKWQTDLGATVTGVIQPAQVFYAAGPVRVASHKVAVGDAATGQLLTYTGITKLVSVDLKVENAGLVRSGAAVTVTLPGATAVAATVADVGTVATAAGGATEGALGGGSDTGPRDSQPTIPVTIRLADQGQAISYDGAPVTVRIIAEKRTNVLCVPVSALLALREGGFGVEVVEGVASRIVAVRVGLFADGRVEIIDGALTEGTAVGVPT
jgi:peptidoglycan hydrolase-like protein with peptidoglycan-binding domain